MYWWLGLVIYCTAETPCICTSVQFINHIILCHIPRGRLAAAFLCLLFSCKPVTFLVFPTFISLSFRIFSIWYDFLSLQYIEEQNVEWLFFILSLSGRKYIGPLSFVTCHDESTILPTKHQFTENTDCLVL